MAALDSLELRRLEIQRRLDAQKTAQERNRLGQFATPTALAQDILSFASQILPEDQPIRFLDPAIGTGSFYSALLATFPAARITSASGFEIDPSYGLEAIKLWESTGLRLIFADFTKRDPPTDDSLKASLLICNPPYVRHHHLSSDEKRRLQRRVSAQTGLQLSGLAGLYCYFLLLAHAWMAPDGLAGWLIPSEFLDVAYGQTVKHYLLNHVTTLRIHRFDASDLQFDDALVSSSIVWLRNRLPPDDHVIEFSYGGSLSSPRSIKHVSATTLKSTSKWNGTVHSGPRGVRREEPETPRLADLFRIKRGIATGNNNFFILTKEAISARGLPANLFIPILPSPRHLIGDEIEADSDGNPRIEPVRFLLNCSLPEHVIRREYPSLWTYLQQGIERGVNKSYLCRHRSPWYAQEHRPPTAFLCNYMGRQRKANSRPFRFILNHSRATAPNVYLMLYPNSDLNEAIRRDPELTRRIWLALNQIPVELLQTEGRLYGGGLHKTEPRELGQVPANLIVDVVQSSLPKRLF